MNPELGNLSTALVYAAMAAYLVAMIAFAVDVSALGVGASKDRRRRAANIGLSVTWLGAGLHLAAVLVRAAAAERVPWANMYEFTLMFTLFLVGIYLGIQTKRDVRYLGVGVTFLAFLALLLAVSVLFVAADGVPPALDSYWLVIHVSVATLATGLSGLAALISVLQILKSRGDHDGGSPVPEVPSGGAGVAGANVAVSERVVAAPSTPLARVLSAVPPAENLERLAYRLNAVGFVAWTFTLVAGAVWAEHAWGRPWGWDPKETWTFVIWVIYAAYLHARVTTGWAAEKFAYFAIVGFMAVVANFYVVNLFFSGKHSYAGV